MLRGASFHLKAVLNPRAAQAHNLRDWSLEHPPPPYLLPHLMRQGCERVIDADDVIETHRTKSALASPQARAKKGFSPVWEGVLNLPAPPAD